MSVSTIYSSYIAGVSAFLKRLLREFSFETLVVFLLLIVFDRVWPAWLAFPGLLSCVMIFWNVFSKSCLFFLILSISALTYFKSNYFFVSSFYVFLWLIDSSINALALVDIIITGEKVLRFLSSTWSFPACFALLLLFVTTN